MNQTMKFRGYEGSIECDFEENLLTGKVLGIRVGLVYEASSLIDLKQAFEQTVSDYLQYCKDNSIEPEKPFREI